MSGVLGTILAKIAVAILEALWARKDLKDAVRKEILLFFERAARKAEEWKAAHPIDLSSDPRDDFPRRVRSGPRPVRPEDPGEADS